MRKKNQKEELPGSPECSATLPGFIVDETHAAQGSAPRPGELRIPGDRFVKGRSKLLDYFATALPVVYSVRDRKSGRPVQSSAVRSRR